MYLNLIIFLKFNSVNFSAFEFGFYLVLFCVHVASLYFILFDSFNFMTFSNIPSLIPIKKLKWRVVSVYFPDESILSSVQIGITCVFQSWDTYGPHEQWIVASLLSHFCVLHFCCSDSSGSILSMITSFSTWASSSFVHILQNMLIYWHLL